TILTLSTSFYFNHTATTYTYTLSLHDALPICFLQRRFSAPRHRLCMYYFRRRFCPQYPCRGRSGLLRCANRRSRRSGSRLDSIRSEEHTSELQSPCNLVCRLLLEKKKKIIKIIQQYQQYTQYPDHLIQVAVHTHDHIAVRQSPTRSYPRILLKHRLHQPPVLSARA